jgi:neutral amino acid transport system permease protein
VVARRFVQVVGLLVIGIAALCVGAVSIGATPAHADSGQAIVGTLRTNDRQPVSGVTITVTSSSGFKKSVSTKVDGTFSIPVPGGDYTVTLDETTLPSGTPTPVTNPLSVTVNPGNPTFVLFKLGQPARRTESKFAQLPQYIVDGFRVGLIIALGAVGLSLIYGTTGLTNFAHGEIITFGALITYTFNTTLHMGLLLAGLLGVIATGIFGLFLDRGLWKPLRRRGTGLIAMMIVSIGLALSLRSLYLIIYGGQPKPYNQFTAQAGISIGSIDVTPADIAITVMAGVVLILSGLALLRTRIGKATRAVADNPALASTTGIDVEQVILVVWVCGAALAGLCGIFLAVSQQVAFNLGQNILLLVFAAVTLGGLGTAFGALVGSLVIGVLTQVSVWFGVPAELQNVTALAILIIILMVKPVGLLGRRSRIG